MSKSKRILIFEWLCSGGLWTDGLAPSDLPSLFAQGRDMLKAVASDFADAECDVSLLIDSRIDACEFSMANQHVKIGSQSDLRQSLLSAADECDHVLIIAPETDGCLVRCLHWLEPFAAKLLNPSLSFTELAASKNKLCNYLIGKGVNAPSGRILTPDLCLSQSGLQFPLVVKPDDGCGGEDLQLFRGGELDATDFPAKGLRVESYLSGIPVSVSVLNGRPLPALRQQFDREPIGHFECSVNDLDGPTRSRAQKLALQTIEALPDCDAFYGVDMVIGDADAVIEVNPRITMSYVLLQKQFADNLADQMIHPDH